MILLKMWLMWV